jgi:hypothetical protein
MASDQGTATDALRRMAESEPELAARMMLQSLPVAAADLPPGLSYRLELSDLGAWRVSPNGGPAEVSEVQPEEQAVSFLHNPILQLSSAEQEPHMSLPEVT